MGVTILWAGELWILEDGESLISQSIFYYSSGKRNYNTQPLPQGVGIFPGLSLWEKERYLVPAGKGVLAGNCLQKGK